MSLEQKSQRSDFCHFFATFVQSRDYKIGDKSANIAGWTFQKRDAQSCRSNETGAKIVRAIKSEKYPWNKSILTGLDLDYDSAESDLAELNAWQRNEAVASAGYIKKQPSDKKRRQCNAAGR